MYRVKRFSISEDRFFNDDYYEDGRKSNSSGSNWVMPTLAGAGLAAGGFYGARKGMFGESLQKTANNAWGSLGNMVGSQSMIDSAANDYTKGLEGDAATKAKNEFLDKHKIVEEQPTSQPAPQNNQPQSQPTESKPTTNGGVGDKPVQQKPDATVDTQNNKNQKTTKKGDGSTYRRYRQNRRGQGQPPVTPQSQPKPQNTNRGGSIFGSIFGGIKKTARKVGSGISSGFAYIGRGAKNIGQKIVNVNAYGNGSSIGSTYIAPSTNRITSGQHAGLQSSVGQKGGKGYMPSVLAMRNEVHERYHGKNMKDASIKEINAFEKERQQMIEKARRQQKKKTDKLNKKFLQRKKTIENRGYLVPNFDVTRYTVKPGTVASYKKPQPVSDPRAEYAARMANKKAGADLYKAEGYKNVTKRVRPKTSFQTAVKRRTFHSDFGIISYKIPRFSQRLFADSEKKDSGSTLGKIVTGTALAAGTFYGARKGMLGNTLRRGSNTLYGQVGKMVGSESMVNSAAANYAKGAVKNPGAFTRMTNSSARDAYQNDLAKSATEFKTNLMTPKQPANPAPAPAPAATNGGTSSGSNAVAPVNNTNNTSTVGGSILARND